MRQRLITVSVLFIFLAVSLFGLMSLLSHPGHHSNCPLQGAATVLCESSTIEHIGIWQGMFVAILLLLVFAVGSLLFSRRGEIAFTADGIYLRRTHIPIPRPTLLQELFSAGILNRKEPYAFSCNS